MRSIFMQLTIIIYYFYCGTLQIEKYFYNIIVSVFKQDFEYFTETAILC